MNYIEFERLLREFERLPKIVPQTTYLEICRYPRRRFEEICSRLLCFYFNPMNEHGFNDLFLKSILELLTNETVSYKNDEIKVVNEENSNGKRLDILIYTPNFAIGIENKITASIYNPLEIYKTRIEQYSKNNSYKILLSLNTITDKKELKLINDSDFISITYSQFFDVIKKNVGNIITQCNQKYLSYLFDFIQTIENMSKDNLLNDQLSNFFFNNKEQLDELVGLYNNHKQHVLNIQKARIADLQEEISKITNAEWWAWENWDLGYNGFNNDKPRIGLESSFKVKNNNPLGEFRIYITTWKIADWVPYDEALRKKFPDYHIDKTNNRVYMHMPPIDGDNETLILEKLKEYYDVLIELTK